MNTAITENDYCQLLYAIANKVGDIAAKPLENDKHRRVARKDLADIRHELAAIESGL